VRALMAGDRRVTGGVLKIACPYMGSGRGWLAGNWPSTGGILNITAPAWTAGFQWWRSGDIRRTQNVSEYMLVLAMPGFYCQDVSQCQFFKHKFVLHITAKPLMHRVC